MQASSDNKKTLLEIGSGTTEINYCLDNPSFNILHFDISKQAKHLEINGDCQTLPFQDNSFEVVYCGHVLEHLTNPFKALKEFNRVSKRLIVLKVPNSVIHHYWIEYEGHLFSWEYQSFYNILKKVFRDVQVSTNIHFRFSKNKIKNVFVLIFNYMLKLFIGDNEITAICFKRD